MEIFLASLGILAGWITYRIQIVNEKNKIIDSLESILDYSGLWLNSSYPSDKNDSKWFNPGKQVYKVDISIVNDIINKSAISKNLSKLLAYFIQLVNRLNYRVDMFNMYLYSNDNLLREASKFYKENCLDDKLYEECRQCVDSINDENLKFYMTRVYALQKSIHIHGIGEQKYYRQEFPHLSLCYKKLEKEMMIIKNSDIGILNDSQYIIADVIFIIIPLGIIIYEAVYFLGIF